MSKKRKHRKVKIILDGEFQEFKVKKSGEIWQSEGLFTSDFVEAVRKLRRWPRKDEFLDETRNGTPCFSSHYALSAAAPAVPNTSGKRE